jgi:hypothetical protein
MGVLKDQVSDESKGSIVKYFKENSMFMYDKYNKPDKLIDSISPSKLSPGYFYFIAYNDQSNWMKYSPVFLVDYKKLDNLIIAYGINMNFIPIEVRTAFFDKFLKNLIDEDQLSNISFEDAYKQLLRIGFEYALVEYNVAFIGRAYKISIEVLPKFLNSTYPAVKYDPQGLYHIWKVKLETKEQRHQEIIKMMVSDFYKITDDMKNEFPMMNKHIDRIQKNLDKNKG